MTENDARIRPVDAPEVDVDEQRRGLAGDDTNAVEPSSQADPEEPDLPPAELPQGLRADVDPADAYEQTRSVDYDEDDYR